MAALGSSPSPNRCPGCPPPATARHPTCNLLCREQDGEHIGLAVGGQRAAEAALQDGVI